MKAVVLAGGRGTRLAPYTAILPKPLMPVGDRPILDIILCQLRSYGFLDVTLAVGYLSELVMAYFGDGRRHGVRITYSQEDRPLGTAGPLGILDPPAEPFLVINGDVLTDMDFAAMHRCHLASRAVATVAVYPRTIQAEFGVIEVGSDDCIVDYVEKPQREALASIGVYVFSPQIARYVPRNRYLDMPELINLLVREGHRPRCFRQVAYWLDIGRPADYEKAQVDMEALGRRILGNGRSDAKYS